MVLRLCANRVGRARRGGLHGGLCRICDVCREGSDLERTKQRATQIRRRFDTVWSASPADGSRRWKISEKFCESLLAEQLDQWIRDVRWRRKLRQVACRFHTMARFALCIQIEPRGRVGLANRFHTTRATTARGRLGTTITLRRPLINTVAGIGGYQPGLTARPDC